MLIPVAAAGDCHRESVKIDVTTHEGLSGTQSLSSGAPVLPTQTHTDNKARASQSTSHPVYFNRKSEATPKENEEATNLNRIYVVFSRL